MDITVVSERLEYLVITVGGILGKDLVIDGILGKD